MDSYEQKKLGRKPKKNKRVKRMFTLRLETAQALDDSVESGYRSDFVDDAISGHIRAKKI